MFNVNHKTITVNILIRNSTENSYKKSFIIDIDETVTTSILIKISIKKFNELFVEEQQNIYFDSDLRHYSLRPSKKDGSPKMDFPGK